MPKFKTEFISKQLEIARANREIIVDFSRDNGGHPWLMNIKECDFLEVLSGRKYFLSAVCFEPLSIIGILKNELPQIRFSSLLHKTVYYMSYRQGLFAIREAQCQTE